MEPASQQGLHNLKHSKVVRQRNASSASGYFCLPPNQILEIGAQIEI